MGESSRTASPEENGPAHGVFDRFARLAAHGVNYLQARLALAGLESREAFLHGLQLAAWLLAGCFVAILGYVLLLLSVAFLVAAWTGWSWALILLIFAVAHFALCAMCLVTARELFKQPVFTTTLNELQKDRQWLNSQIKTPNRN